MIAARDVARASQVASELACGVEVRAIDVTNRAAVDAALTGVGSVISCVTQRGTPHLLLAATAHGCAYTDIAPMWAHSHPPSEALKAEATNTGARIIVGAGLVPGMSSVLARMGHDCVGPVDTVVSTCLLSAGDDYGVNSRQNLAEEFVTPFQTTFNGKTIRVWPFTRPRRVKFAPPIGPVTAYRILFTDQLYYPDTLGARTAVSRLAFLPGWPLALLSVCLPIARNAFMRRQGGMGSGLNRLLAWLKRRYPNLDWWGVHVEVRGLHGLYRASMQGQGQATATALSASAFLRALIEGEVERAGIWAAEQVVPVESFLARLAMDGLTPRIDVELAGPLSHCPA